jgi:hypothetical protein
LRVTSIERTAYPQFKRLTSARVLHVFFTPAAEEIAWAQERTASPESLFALVLALKCFQKMARFCPLEEIPEAVTGHVRRCLGLDPETVPNAAWFRRRQSGGRGWAERLDGAGQRGQDGGETGGEAGVMDAVPRDSRCGSGPIMQS